MTEMPSGPAFIPARWPHEKVGPEWVHLRYGYVWKPATEGTMAGWRRPKAQRHPKPGRVTGPVRLIQAVAGVWAMTNDELASLLAYPSPQLAGDLVAGRLTFGGNNDRQDRARLIYLIHSTLSDLFLDPDQERRWVRAPHPLLSGETPLNVMLARGIPGMLTVREILERHLANRR